MSSTFVRSALALVACTTLAAAFSACASAQDDHVTDEDVFVLETGDDEAHPAPRVQFFNRMPGGPALAGLAFGPRARLGVVVEPTDDGLQVSEVQDDSLALAAGVQVGDLLHRVGKTRVHTTGDVAMALRGRQAGDEVDLAVIREGVGLVELSGTLPETPESPAAAAGRGALLGVDLDEQDGRVLVAGVVEHSAAWFAGVEQGDVLTSLDGTPVTGAQDVVDFVTGHAPGDFVALGVERDGAAHELRARLGARRGGDDLLRFVSPGSLDGDLGRLLPHGLRWNPDGPRALGLPGRQAYALRFGHDDDQPLGEWNTWLQKLHEDGALGGVQRTRVEIKDGVVTIERDGEVETYQLDELEDVPFPRLRRPLHEDADSGEVEDEDEHHDASWRTGPQDV